MPGDDIPRVRAPTNKSAISDSLQRRTGFHSFIAAYRVFTGSWPAGSREKQNKGVLKLR
ncbi:hypothetical protein ALC60_06593 [Trachymyrmex zeteki]|uniref:Uncharacterized protein n=1 Tax=Mycetomoellerius zeteki TaxID=64791 RepID=A0A151X2C0_9HYME|nr:hypothetical protein ALC60_06593 [Trachymyrmex zeteki]